MPLGPVLLLSAVLFTIGVVGVLLRRNAIVLFMCVELMLNAVNLTFVALAQRLGLDGQVFVFFVMTVAAAEAAVGLAIIIALYRHRDTVNLADINLLRGCCFFRPPSPPLHIPSPARRPSGCGCCRSFRSSDF